MNRGLPVPETGQQQRQLFDGISYVPQDTSRKQPVLALTTHLDPTGTLILPCLLDEISGRSLNFFFSICFRHKNSFILEILAQSNMKIKTPDSNSEDLSFSNVFVSSLET